MNLLHIRATDKCVQDFMTSVAKENLELREGNNVIRKDFFQLLMQLRNKGSITQNDDDEWKTEFECVKNDGSGKFLSLNEMTAQSFIFFAGGFETTSTTMSFCLYELAKATEIQKKIHDEIDQVLAKFNGELSYDSVSEMKYLECCIDCEILGQLNLPLIKN